MTCHAVAVSDSAFSAVELHDSTPFFCTPSDSARFAVAVSDATPYAVIIDDLHNDEPTP